MKRLLEIQKEIKCTKSQHNSFGNYNYRSCEDILVAVKPLLAKHGLTLTLSDSIICTENGRCYVRADVTLRDAETGTVLETTTAFAREAETKKGMDESQITGTASSYARKYALNGLLLLDDNKDADTNEYQGNEEKYISDKQITLIESLIKEAGKDKAAMLSYYKIDSLDKLPSKKATELINLLKTNIEKGTKK